MCFYELDGKKYIYGEKEIIWLLLQHIHSHDKIFSYDK